MRAQNEMLLLLNLLASRVVRDGRRLTFVIARDSAPDWQRLWGKLAALDWVPG